MSRIHFFLHLSCGHGPKLSIYSQIFLVKGASACVAAGQLSAHLNKSSISGLRVTILTTARQVNFVLHSVYDVTLVFTCGLPRLNYKAKH